MLPEELEQIDLAARRVEYQKHQRDYKPVNQRKVILAGYQAMIDAVAEETRKQVDTEYAKKYLDISYKFNE